MACIISEPLSAHISGLNTDVNNSKDNAIWYKIQVELQTICWYVERRYSDFEALHKKLVDSQGIPRESLVLPPKKLIGNKDPQFVEKRREQLDLYLINCLKLLGQNPPDDLAQFLSLYEYEIIHMLRKLAVEIFDKGDQIIEGGNPFVMSPYQIYAINERMKLPIPPLDSIDKRHDFSHIIDFCTRLEHLEVVGSNIPLGRSTIIANQYSMDLSPFKSLKELTLKTANVAKLSNVEPARKTVERLSILNSHLDSLSQLLLSDTVYKVYDEAGPRHVWSNVRSLNLSNNVIRNLNDIGKLVPALQRIDLSYNQLCTIFSLTSLPYLEHVTYAGNVISYLTDLHLNFGNITSIDLSQNQVEQLDGFSKLYSLVDLNLSCNLVSDVEEVKHLADLPCLEVLILTGNPVASTVDYRVIALSYFGQRANDISLDNEKASFTESDQISIRQAIELARQSML